jgi:hypothetical protein
MQPSDNQLHYFISYAFAFIVFALISRWYLWPAIKDRSPKMALSQSTPFLCVFAR